MSFKSPGNLVISANLSVDIRVLGATLRFLLHEGGCFRLTGSEAVGKLEVLDRVLCFSTRYFLTGFSLGQREAQRGYHA